MQTVGKYIEAGLPNITGKVYARGIGGEADTLGWEEGAFYRDTTDIRSELNVTGTARYWDAYAYTFNATRSSDIYGNSDTVQPPSGAVNFIIKVDPTY